MERNKFMFFKNFAETIKEFPEEKQAEAYKAICEYGIYGILPEDESLKIMCLMAKASIYKEDGRKNNGGKREGAGRPKNQDENQDEKNKNHLENGWGGKREGAGRPKSAENQEKKSSLENQINQKNQILSRTETETETEIKRDSIEKNQVDFSPPTEQEVLEYAKQMDMTVGMGGFECCPEQARLFFAYYDKVGWLDKEKIPIIDWKKSFKYWVRRDDMQRYQKEQRC